MHLIKAMDQLRIGSLPSRKLSVQPSQAVPSSPTLVSLLSLGHVSLPLNMMTALAPWFQPGGRWGGGGYLKVEQTVGSAIDWYNIQFYNRKPHFVLHSATAIQIVHNCNLSRGDQRVHGLQWPLDAILLGLAKN